jgi:hypothetical protein
MTKWKVVYVSEEHAHGRSITVDAAMDICQVCKHTTDVLGIDCSEHEYLSFVCCAPCLNKLFAKGKI